MKKNLVSLLLAGAAASTAFAASDTYRGPGGPWSNAERWLGGTPAEGAGFTATIDRTPWTSAGTVNVDMASLTIGSIEFIGVPTAQRNTILNGNAITLNNSGSASLISNAGWGGVTINNSLTLANDLDLKNTPVNNLGVAVDRFLTLAGSISSDGALRTITTLASDQEPATAQQYRIVLGGAISGNVAIRHNSGNALNLQDSAKTFTGGLNIRSGVVRAGGGLGSTVLGGASNVITFESGGAKPAALEFVGIVAAGSEANATVSQAIVLQGNGVIRVAFDADSATDMVEQDGVVSGSGNLIKTGDGALVLNALNIYAGNTVISEGSLLLGRDNAINAVSKLVLDGGVFNAEGFSQSFSALSLTGVAVIDLGDGGANTVSFGDSSAEDWGVYGLAIIGDFTDGASVRFGTSSNGLTTEQLALVSVNGVTGYALDANGYLVVPEPSTWAMIIGGVSLAGVAIARRRRA